jgi:hypothetical protein
MSMIESGKQVVIAVVTSAVIGLGGQLLTLGSQRDLLNETRDATKILSQAVTELRIQVAEDRGKYVTRDEIKAELKEVRRGS